MSLIPIVSLLRQDEGKAVEAVELMGLVETHPNSASGWLTHWKLYRVKQKTLKIQLGEDAYNATYEHGTTLDIEIVVRDLLAEFEQGCD
jgi:hypothetical protein